MTWKIDMDHVRATFETYGLDTPFYEYETSLPPPNLKELVRKGFLIRAGNRNRGFMWTESVRTLLAEADGREARTAAMRDAYLSGAEPHRGYAHGCRRVPSLPDSDGNSTDHDSIDES